MLYAPAIDF